MLPADEIKRRVDAARTLRGMTQTQLAELVHADGLGKHDIGRLERGDIPLTRVLRDALCRHLGVPEEWFTEPSVDRLVARPMRAEDVRAHLERIEAGLRLLAAVEPPPPPAELTRMPESPAPTAGSTDGRDSAREADARRGTAG